MFEEPALDAGGVTVEPVPFAHLTIELDGLRIANLSLWLRCMDLLVGCGVGKEQITK